MLSLPLTVGAVIELLERDGWWLAGPPVCIGISCILSSLAW